MNKKIVGIFVCIFLIFACYSGIGFCLNVEINFNNVNLLTNPGFESGLSGWSDTSDSATWTISNDAFSGINSVKGVEVNPSNLGRLYQDFTNNLNVGRMYKIGGWIKTEDVSGQVVIGLDYVMSNGCCEC